MEGEADEAGNCLKKCWRKKMTLESVYHRNTVNSRVMMSAHMR